MILTFPSQQKLIEKREEILVVDVSATLEPLLMLDIRDFMDVNTTLLISSTKTEGILLIDVLILHRNSCFTISAKSVKVGGEPGTDDLILRRGKEVVLSDTKEVLLQHLLISKSGANTFLIVEFRKEEIVLEILIAIRATPETSSAERILHELGVHEVSYSITSQILGEPNTTITKETILNTSKGDVLGDVVLVLHKHTTGHNTTLRVADEDETITEELFVLSDGLVQEFRSIIDKSLELLQASPFVINIKCKEGVTRLNLVKLFLHLIELKIGSSKAMNTYNRLEGFSGHHTSTNNNKSKHSLEHCFP